MLDATPLSDDVLGLWSDAASASDAADTQVERREKRTPANLIGLIRLPDATEIPCIVKDVSPSGAKLGVPGTCALPDRFAFKIANRDLVFLVRLAWRRGHYAGVRIERIGKLPPGQRRG